MSARGYASKHSFFPTTGLLFKAMASNGMVDTVGESSIIIDSGLASDFTNSTFHWPYNTTTDALDTALGGDILFVGTTHRSMSWLEWMMWGGINVDYLFLGVRGAVGYNTDQSTNAVKIRRYLNSADQSLPMDWSDGIPVIIYHNEWCDGGLYGYRV